jgi:alkylation response protein AidB-like acyl-CoA dehydrogenase
VDPVLTKLAQLIREEFEDAPALRLTVSEASRFWGLDEKTCRQIFTRLMATGFLARGVDERYGRRPTETGTSNVTWS